MSENIFKNPHSKDIINVEETSQKLEYDYMKPLVSNKTTQ